MFAWLERLIARLFRTPPEQPYEHRPVSQVQTAVTCLHGAGFGPIHWHAKGTVPGYKGAGWFSQCLSWCGKCIPA